MRVKSSAWAGVMLAALLATAPWRAALGQQLPIKRTLGSAGESICPRFPRPVPPTPEQSAEARRLSQQGNDAALVGDHKEARDLLRQAAQLDLTAQDIAYLLGREHEEVGAASDAIREYCRYLSLAPQASDAPDVRERIGRLSPQQSLSASDLAAAQFGAGVEHYERGRFTEALNAFNAVLADVPDAAAAYYNRGVVQSVLGRARPAQSDFERYLALQPRASDRRSVDAQIDRLRRAMLDPTTALAIGAVAPGGGQFYTRRPLLGGLVLAGTLGAALWAIQPKDMLVPEEFPSPFPGGQPYTQMVEKRGFPNATAGTITAVSIALLGAAEAYWYTARGRRALQRPPQRSTPSAAQRSTALDAGEARRAHWDGVLVAPGTKGEALVGARLRF